MLCGLDQSPTQIGWCYGDIDVAPVFGCWEPPDFGSDDARLQNAIRKWLLNLVKSAGITAIFFEELVIPRTFSHKPSLDKKYAVVAGINCLFGDLGTEIYDVNITKWRKLFFGAVRGPNRESSNTDWFKAKALEECANRGWWTDNHHAAEACGIWHCAMCDTYPLYRRREKPLARRVELKADEERIRSGGRL